MIYTFKCKYICAKHYSLLFLCDDAFIRHTYIYIYIYMYIYIYTCIYIYKCIYTYIYIYHI